MTRRHRILAAAFAGPFGLFGLGSGVPAAVAQPIEQTPVSAAPIRLAHAQQARISGTVRDDRGEAVAGALVTALGATSLLAVSDTQGNFSLTLPPGEYQLRVHSDGYSSTFREMVLVGARANLTRSIVLNRTGERAVLAAGLGGRAVLPPSVATDPKAHPHGEQAWRLRHLKRTILRDGTAVAEAYGDYEDDERGAWEAIGRAVGMPARLATAFFSDLPIDGEFRLLTAGSFGPYSPAFDEAGGAGAAYLSVRSQIGSHGEWSARATMSSADYGTWLVAGDYVARSTNTHAFNVGMTYGSQGMPRLERTPVPATAVMPERSRHAGQVYAFDRWTMSPHAVVDGGVRVDYVDYLPHEAVLWSPVVSLELTPWENGTAFKVAASSRRDVPGAAEFTPAAAGPWLPPQRMFAPLPGNEFAVQRTDHTEAGVEHRFKGSYAIGLRRFSQQAINQVTTMFGLEGPALTTDPGHYYVATVGDASVGGWVMRVATPENQPVRGAIEYAVAEVAWTPTADLSGIGPVARLADERIHDITTSINADVPQTRTRVFVVYRVSNAFASEDGASMGARFDMQLNQGLPFLPDNAGQWEVLLSMRNTLRDQRFGMSLLDELLAVSTPTRVVGGVQVKF